MTHFPAFGGVFGSFESSVSGSSGFLCGGPGGRDLLRALCALSWSAGSAFSVLGASGFLCGGRDLLRALSAMSVSWCS